MCHKLLAMCCAGLVSAAAAAVAQVSLVSEMEMFAARCQGSAEAWAEQLEGVATEELDGRLRAHRPRAGRIEEEVRLAGA